ncbi:hypothetical protein Y032_0028g1797 [Ancylostoma ceylanicum]|uniref:Uncharacterized protein n=3 Tax=Ancylostoma ceylanicum TaxID=53326 RepID=A0A016UTP4_9BILA|nr:hypothetical protein Y032_0028g1797 [Ancylostoma ceylanicum]
MSSFVSDSPTRRAKYKSVMNLLRRALRMRDPSNDSTAHANCNGTQKRIGLDSDFNRPSSLETISVQTTASPIANSDAASTSRESTPSIEIAPSLYEDPFVAITVDGLIFVKNYNVYNQRAEFHGESIMLPYVQRVSRVLKISRLRTVYYASPPECQDAQACKPWGITCNDVWWASHLNRQEACNRFYSVVLDDKTTLRAGFSVVCLDTFIESLRYLGLKPDTRFVVEVFKEQR